MASIFKWGVTDSTKFIQCVAKFLAFPSKNTTEEFVDATEKAAKIYPNEWVIFYKLGDFYQKLGYYARSLQACKRCVEINPDDIRSTYALATAYNVITRAEWAPYQEELKSVISYMSEHTPYRFDPEHTREELYDMGMVTDTAATQAMRWFERSMMLRPDERSRKQIQMDLLILYDRYPNLKR